MNTFEFDHMLHFSMLQQQQQQQNHSHQQQHPMVPAQQMAQPAEAYMSFTYPEFIGYPQHAAEPSYASNYTYAAPELFDFLPHADSVSLYFPSSTGFEMAPMPQECISLDAYPTDTHFASPLEKSHFFEPVHYTPQLEATSFQHIEQPHFYEQAEVSLETVKTKHTGSRCHLCNKYIRRDMTRHLRTHESVSRFQCTFLKEQCPHKTHQFNRPYDFKKHLLNCHFNFSSSSAKKLHNLNEKLAHEGTCPCNKHRVFTADEWLHEHILATEESKQCPLNQNF